MKHKFPFKDAFKFSWPGIKGYAFNSKDDFERASAAIFEVEDRHGKVKNLVSDRIYLVLSGSGEFIIEDNNITVEKDDVIIVPKNTVYDYKGRMKLFLVHSPAYNPEQDIDFENIQNS